MQFGQLRRREFITLIGGAAACPLVARAQQPDRMRRIGVLMNLSVDDPEAPSRVAAFAQGLGELGWNIGRNVWIDYRWGGGGSGAAFFHKQATEVVALAPDVILASGHPSIAALQPITRSVPVVFVLVADPVGAGIVESLARPGGNVTGFAVYEFSMSGKWLELLKRIAPDVARVGVLRDADLTAGVAYFAAIQSVAPSLGVEVSPIGVRDASEIEHAVAAFARSSNAGLIVTPSPYTAPKRNLIIALAARHNLPAVYYERYVVAAGGLASYGSDFFDQYRRAAGYIDRILKGEKPADVPVQSPTKYQTVINLKTAKALGIEILPTVLATADEVIE
jgi:putative tryptophan/tyrosine transport system substrate-binding protein